MKTNKFDRFSNELELRKQWEIAHESLSKLSSELFQPGSGYGDPEARLQDEHRLQSAKENSDRLYRQYQDAVTNRINLELLSIQKSQRLATWSSFAVAVAVGIATVINLLSPLLR